MPVSRRDTGGGEQGETGDGKKRISGALSRWLADANHKGNYTRLALGCQCEPWDKLENPGGLGGAEKDFCEYGTEEKCPRNPKSRGHIHGKQEGGFML